MQGAIQVLCFTFTFTFASAAHVSHITLLLNMLHLWASSSSCIIVLLSPFDYLKIFACHVLTCTHHMSTIDSTTMLKILLLLWIIAKLVAHRMLLTVALFLPHASCWWLGGLVVRTLDLRLLVADLNPGHDTAQLFLR